MAFHLFFKSALLPAGWVDDVRLTVADGVIQSVTTGAAPHAEDERHAIAIPGMANLHSHAFQRAIAGLTESRGSATDSFWSWRALMYRFAHSMTPEDVQAVAAQAFAEMLETGFCAVAEFHYLHHSPDGTPYADIAEMAGRIAAAASETGIGLTLLPVFYAHAGFGGLPPAAAQRRFISTLDQYVALYQGCAALAATGIAPHSLRAVTPQELSALTSLAPGRPLHIHIAEQIREVEDCLAWSGVRPLTWLLDHAPVADNWCLVHATHATADERARIAATGAVAGLCPLTEANLGDGIFDAVDYAAQQGRFGLGSDSNVQISAAAEIRQLEYSQRLLHRQRNSLASATQPATATAIHAAATQGGAQALGRALSGLRPGAAADIVTLQPGYAATPADALNIAVFAAPQPMIDCVWAAGRQLVSAGRHRHAVPIREKFDSTMARLLA